MSAYTRRKFQIQESNTCGQRKIMNAADRINDGAGSSAARTAEIMQIGNENASTTTSDCVGVDCLRSSFMKTHWAAASARFTTMFINNPFGHKCDVCDRLWFLCSLKPTNEKHLPLLNNAFSEELVADFKLCGQPLYKHYKITVNWDTFQAYAITRCVTANAAGEDPIEHLQCDRSALESDVLLARQHTMLWNEEHCLHVVPGQHSMALNIIYDVYAEKLSFPLIYYGTGRQFNSDVPVTPLMIATSEIGRSNRRGVTPEQV
ncbi:unnamed protein product [Hermetia illucens]|uniref:Uncharacterized protein n=1 Tax=Hermetia illucens TaxID=343691 RepID=A0A7R8YWV4_HERIL|nr:unnamed protein product [Hermetia illucens]